MLEFSKKVKDFVNEITDGAFYDSKTLCHVVGGEGLDEHSQEHKKRRLRHPHQEDGLLYEEVFDIDNASSSSLWFNAGGSAWFQEDMTNIIILCNSERKRFYDEVEGVVPYGGLNKKEREDRWSNMPTKELLREAISSGKMVGRGGTNLSFKKDEKWLDIADWIVDLYHGRLYKITEKEEDRQE